MARHRLATQCLIPASIKEAYASAPPDVVIIHTIELRHPVFVDEVGTPAPIRVVLDNRNWTGRLENSAPLNGGEFVNFTAFNFNVTLPEVGVDAQPELVLKIDNVNHEIQQNVAAAVVSDELVQMTYRPYLSNDVDVNGYFNYPQMDPPLHLDVNYIKIDVFQVEAHCSFGDSVSPLKNTRLSVFLD